MGSAQLSPMTALKGWKRAMSMPGLDVSVAVSGSRALEEQGVARVKRREEAVAAPDPNTDAPRVARWPP